MKKILQNLFINALSLFFLTLIFPGIKIQQGWQGIVITGLGFTLIDILLKPVLKIIFLPLNLLTLGTLSWIINVISFGLLLLFIPQINVQAFYFNGLQWSGLTITGFKVNVIVSLISASFLIVFIKQVILWLTER